MVANETTQIQFRTETPIPPRRRIYACLALVRNYWLDKECIETITIEGPFAGTVRFDLLRDFDRY
jgi:hypothetical protein